MNNQGAVVCVGDSCVDVYLAPFQGRYLGGNAVNTAVAAANAGAKTAYLGAAGDDAPGQALLAALRERGVDTTHLQVLPGPTNLSHVRLNRRGQPTYVHSLNPAHRSAPLTTEALRFLMQQAAVHTSWLWPAVEQIPALRLSPGLLVSIDYGARPARRLLDRTLPFAGLAFFSLPARSAAAAPELAQSYHARGARVVILNLGPAGTLAYDGQIYHQPALPVPVVDTLGAGDAFAGVFLARYCQGQSLPACLEAAAQAAADTCRHPGAWPGAALPL